MIEAEDRDFIDFQMNEAMLAYKNQLRNSTRDILFGVSDMKEGFHKDFFDTLQIHDDIVPLVSTSILRFNLIFFS